jgi:hypothetical protein
LKPFALRKVAFIGDRQKRNIDKRDACWMRSAAIAVIRNRWMDDSEASISAAAALSEELGARLAPQIVAALGAPVVTYGKGMLLGADVSEAIGAAMIHARIGKPIRAAVGGGAAVIPSNIKRATFNTTIDVPLGHKDDPWEFGFAETLPVALHDAPAADEFVLCLAVGGEVLAKDPLDVAFPGAEP